MKKTLVLGFVWLAVTLPIAADNTVTKGIDIWETKGDGRTYVELSLPAGFFCASSAPWSGTVTLAGEPILTSPAGVLGHSDTVIERLSDTTFDTNNVATVNAIVRATCFKGTAPIAVSGCPGSVYWDVKSTAAPTQSPFPITIRRSSSSSSGGSFDSSVRISPRLVFTQQGSGLQRTLDQDAISFSTAGAEWTHQPGSSAVKYTSQVQIDTDCDGAVDTTVPGTSNFAPGWTTVSQTGCSAPPCPVPIPHQGPGHVHHVFPPSPSGPCTYSCPTYWSTTDTLWGVEATCEAAYASAVAAVEAQAYQRCNGDVCEFGAVTVVTQCMDKDGMKRVDVTIQYKCGRERCTLEP